MSESVDTLNERLVREYGRFSTTDLPLWRIVFSDDQFEKRWTAHTREGFELLNPEVSEVPKYRQWVQGKYILERLIAIPEFVENDLTDKISYEPVWVFEDSKGNPLPPFWPAIVLIAEQVYSAAAKRVGAKYKDPEVFDKKDAPEAKRAKVEQLVEELFGNETDTGDALAHGDGVIVPRNYERTQ